MRSATSLALLGLCIGPALAQSQPDVVEILNKVKQAYTATNRDSKSYEIEETGTERDPASGQTESFTLHLSFKLPDQFKLEIKGDFGEPGIDELQMISDGTTSWEWSPKTRQYRSYKAADKVPDSVNPTVVDDEFGIWRFGFITSWGHDAKLIREDHLTFEGQSTDCWVIETPGSKGGQFWIDKNSHYVLRLVYSNGTSMEYKTLKLNQPLSDELFKFQPPLDAKRVADGAPFNR